jgi:hypothetical protein
MNTNALTYRHLYDDLRISEKAIDELSVDKK